MSDFNNILEKTLKNEGLYSDDKDDLGGETFMGISRANFPEWMGWNIIDSHKNNPDFPKSLKFHSELQSMVIEFYQENFWDKIQGYKITDLRVSESMFDFAVNAGVRTSIILAQRIVGATVDGVQGNETISKINNFNAQLFVAEFMVAKIRHYLSIVEKHPVNLKFFHGWVRRAVK